MNRLSTGILVFILALIACKKYEPGNPDFDADKIDGTWVLETASRNGLETKTLYGLFYKFEDSTIISNITGDTSEASFVMKEGKIVHLVEDTIYYDVALLNDSFLQLNSVIRSMPFEFKFRKYIEGGEITDSLEIEDSLQ